MEDDPTATQSTPRSDTVLARDAATRIIIYCKDTWKSTVQHARPKGAIRALRPASSPALLKRTTHHAQLFKLHTGTRPDRPVNPLLKVEAFRRFLA